MPARESGYAAGIYYVFRPGVGYRSTIVYLTYTYHYAMLSSPLEGQIARQ